MKAHPRVALAGTELECFDTTEAAFLHHDVGAYFERGVQLARGDTVLDVGANIGVFAAEVSHRLGGEVEVLAFEPVRPIYEVLARNAAHAIDGVIHAIPCGLGTREDTVEFSYFPLMSFLSSAHRDASNVGRESARVAASLLALVKSGRVMPHLALLPEPLLAGYLESYLRSRMKLERHAGRIRPLSAVIAERTVARVHLLKIDVEGAEAAVLDGIAAEHWPCIDQVVVEVEGYAANAREIGARLEARGFVVERAQDAVQRAGDCGLLYALRAERSGI